MKCPKCGAVTYAGLAKCKQCGFELTRAAPEARSSPVTTIFPEGIPESPSLDLSLELPPSAPSKEISPVLEDPLRRRDPTPAKRAVSGATLEAGQQKWLEVGGVDHLPIEDASAAGDWRDELTTRVEDYRKRKSKPQRETNVPQSLDLDFVGSLDEPALVDAGTEEPGEFAPTLEVDLENSHERVLDRAETSKRLEEMEREADAHEAELPGSPQFPQAQEENPFDVVVSPSAAEEEQAETAMVAPVGRRFVAGLTDATVLVLGAALFGLIFWRSGGHLSPNPLNYVVLSFMGVIETFSYFALFTALASGTPGLLWLGCEIRNLQGDCPSRNEAYWRAFGVLVSLSALMLGFIWAWVDSEGLTWHDRMSGTFITLAPHPRSVSVVEAHS